MSAAAPLSHPPPQKWYFLFSWQANIQIIIQTRKSVLKNCWSFPFITRRVFFFVSETIAWKNEEQLPKAIEKFQVSGYLLRKWLEREIFSKELQW